MKKNRNKKKKEQKPLSNPRDKKAERIIYLILVLLIIGAIIIGLNMSKEVSGM